MGDMSGDLALVLAIPRGVPVSDVVLRLKDIDELMVPNVVLYIASPDEAISDKVVKEAVQNKAVSLAEVVHTACPYSFHELCRRACNQGAGFVAVWDCVSSVCFGKVSDLPGTFSRLAHTHNVPEGMGVVTAGELAIVARPHFQAFGGNIAPPTIASSSVAPFLAALYRRWGCCDVSWGAPDLVDGEWKYVLLPDAVAAVANHVKRAPSVVVDVVVPSYRVDRTFITGILALSKEDPETGFIVVVDNPGKDISWLADEGCVATVKQHDVNQGASAARNTGLAASNADWVIFLDDDVVPQGGLVRAYREAITVHGSTTDGFVGVTNLPKDDRVFPLAVYMSEVAGFWTMADVLPAMPWGVTANIAVRQSRKRFDTNFIKTGGGEDIDYCLNLDRWPMKPVPQAVCKHPWWSGGERCYRHFFNWALGNCLLADKHREIIYRTFPNSLELTLFLFLLLPFAPYRVVVAALTVFLVDFALDFVTNLLFKQRDYPASFSTRVMASAEANLVKLQMDAGHLAGQMKHAKLHHICKRIDFFCGLQPALRDAQREKDFLRFACFGIAMWGTSSC